MSKREKLTLEKALEIYRACQQKTRDDPLPDCGKCPIYRQLHLEVGDGLIQLSFTLCGVFQEIEDIL